jgi:MarR family transcriptional regulator for hemolysin
MLEHDFQSSVGYWLCTSAHAMQRALNEELAPLGVTFRQWQVLAWLAIEGSLAQNELAERMQIEPATLVTVLDRMELHDWISRFPCPGDRRKKLVRATDKAEPIWRESVACARKVREEAVRDFSPSEREQFLNLLRRVQVNLSALAAREVG